MSTEIKIRQNDIDQALSKMKSATTALHTSLPAEVGAGNELIIVQKWQDLHQALEQMIESYKFLLQQNEEAASQAVQSMVDLDEKLSHEKTLE